MSRHLADRRNHVLDILVRHPMEHGQTDQSFVGCFGNWVFAALVTKLTPIVRVEVHRNVMDVYADVFGAKRAEDIPAVRTEVYRVNTNRIQMPRGVTSGRTLGETMPVIFWNASV